MHANPHAYVPPVQCTGCARWKLPALLYNLLAVTVIHDWFAKQLSLHLVFLAHSCLRREDQGGAFVGTALLCSTSGGT